MKWQTAHLIAAETPPETVLQDVDTSLGNGFHRGIT
jgi:PleD family two-component response regulator